MKLSVNQKEKGNMKTRLLTAISAIALAALTVTAGEALLSPRAKDNQARPGTPVETSATLATVNPSTVESPRATASKISVVSGRESATLIKCAAIGTPRQADLFGSCCKVAPSLCKAKTTTAACCAK
jgi:hypothetical protein